MGRTSELPLRGANKANADGVWTHVGWETSASWDGTRQVAGVVVGKGGIEKKARSAARVLCERGGEGNTYVSGASRDAKKRRRISSLRAGRPTRSKARDLGLSVVEVAAVLMCVRCKCKQMPRCGV